ncbi:cytochrome b [Asticcacaulis sp. SL142]|uniref:cytochrome b n=1 Tax=Asticcacaulis sp. SL142 TaxID=2995155 RepID=UPI00226CAF59|nr:cytochrome b [Asticcacaulis sp. SL142]WAC48284.1 cytochrome b [Asticcacaulis sp. SL142]
MTRFHLTLRLLHWFMAALIIAMLFIGVGMVSTAGPAYPWLLALHRLVGIALLALVVIRLTLRWRLGAPALPHDLPGWQKMAARAVHLTFYGLLLAMPMIGWAMLSASGTPVVLINGVILPPIAPHDLQLFAGLRKLHTCLAFIFFALILGHLAVGLAHGLIRKDGVLASMGFGR